MPPVGVAGPQICGPLLRRLDEERLTFGHGLRSQSAAVGPVCIRLDEVIDVQRDEVVVAAAGSVLQWRGAWLA